MLHIIRQPKPPLSQFVECFWLVRSDGDIYGREKILPDGAVELILNLSPPQKLLDVDDPQKFTMFKKSWISGERSKYILVDTTPDYHGIGIRFRPGGAFPFMQFPLSELTDQVVEMELIWGNWINEVRERLGEAPTPKAQFSILERSLLEKANGTLKSNQFVDLALQKILRLDDDLSIKEITRELGVSHKHLTRLFDRVVGLTPKLLSRVTKFQRVLQLVEQRQRVHWTEIAHECCYYDQAHFIRDFKAFSGMSPSEYLALRGPHPNSIIL